MIEGMVEGMVKVDWAEIAAQEFKLTEPSEAVRLLPAAFKLLASPDPRKRDDLAYPALATWLEEGYLDEHLQPVGDQAVHLLTAPEVHTRSFAALALVEVISRDAQVRRLSLATLRKWRGQWSKWYVNEQDLRSFAPKTGWLHALAHGADVAAVLSQHPALTRTDLKAVLNTLLRRLHRVNTAPIQFEDDRLGLAAFLLLTHSQITPIDQLRWLVQLRREFIPAPFKPRTEANAFAVHTARALLMFTHYGAKLPDGTVFPPAPELQKPLLSALKSAFVFAYPD